MHTAFIEIMMGDHVHKVWYLMDEDGQKYRAFLMLEEDGIEFSIDDRSWIGNDDYARILLL